MYSSLVSQSIMWHIRGKFRGFVNFLGISCVTNESRYRNIGLDLIDHTSMWFSVQLKWKPDWSSVPADIHVLIMRQRGDRHYLGEVAGKLWHFTRGNPDTTYQVETECNFGICTKTHWKISTNTQCCCRNLHTSILNPPRLPYMSSLFLPLSSLLLPFFTSTLFLLLLWSLMRSEETVFEYSGATNPLSRRVWDLSDSCTTSVLLSPCVFALQTTLVCAPTPKSLFSGLQEQKPINRWGQVSLYICSGLQGFGRCRYSSYEISAFCCTCVRCHTHSVSRGKTKLTHYVFYTPSTHITVDWWKSSHTKEIFFDGWWSVVAQICLTGHFSGGYNMWSDTKS